MLGKRWQMSGVRRRTVEFLISNSLTLAASAETGANLPVGLILVRRQNSPPLLISPVAQLNCSILWESTTRIWHSNSNGRVTSVFILFFLCTLLPVTSQIDSQMTGHWAWTCHYIELFHTHEARHDSLFCMQMRLLVCRIRSIPETNLFLMIVFVKNLLIERTWIINELEAGFFLHLLLYTNFALFVLFIVFIYSYCSTWNDSSNFCQRSDIEARLTDLWIFKKNSFNLFEYRIGRSMNFRSVLTKIFTKTRWKSFYFNCSSRWDLGETVAFIFRTMCDTTNNNRGFNEKTHKKQIEM